MGLDYFQVELDNVERSYFAGNYVSGRVIIKNPKPKKIQGIKLKLIGKAKTQWQERSGRSSNTVGDSETYIDEKVYLFGYTGTEINLKAGEHKFRFYFKLPLGIPSSFEHKLGFVKYYLEAVVSRSLKSNFTARTIFTVNGILDLNEVWEASHAGELTEDKDICCLCCSSGKVGFSLQFPRVGFVPGEHIAFNSEIVNHSRKTIKATILSLYQYVQFHAKYHRSKYKKILIKRIIGPRIDSGETRQWSNAFLQIPPVPPNNLGGCRIIGLYYYIKMKLVIQDSTNLEGKLRVTVGTIPLRNTFRNFLHPANEDQDQPRCSVEPYEPLLKIEAYPDLPPPSYNQAVKYCKSATNPGGRSKISIDYDADTDENDESISLPDYMTALGLNEKNDLENFIPNYVIYTEKSDQAKNS